MTNSPISEEVLIHLRENQFNEMADELHEFLNLMNDSNDLKVALEAANRVQGLCRARVLGDLNIQTIDGNDWLKLLTKLSKRTAKIAKKMG